MIDLLFRPTPRVVNLIAKIERFAGRWEHVSRNPIVASASSQAEALTSGVEAVLELDTTSPPRTTRIGTVDPAHQTALFSSSLASEDSAPESAQHSGDVEGDLWPETKTFIAAHTLPFEFSTEGLQFLFDFIASKEAKARIQPLLPSENGFRTVNVAFAAPSLGAGLDQTLFPAVPVFLIESRLRELLSWTERQLELGNIHPLVVIGIFHLLFLQIHPFPSANHRLSFLLSWKLMRENGFEFVCSSHFAPFLAENSEWYFRSLRQAEKTAGGDWSTLNSWLELFLESVSEAGELLNSESVKYSGRFVPTTVQKRIIDIVRRNGAATRETIATATGIAVSTVKYNLSVLAGKGQLKREGGGRSTSYRAL